MDQEAVLVNSSKGEMQMYSPTATTEAKKQGSISPWLSFVTENKSRGPQKEEVVISSVGRPTPPHHAEPQGNTKLPAISAVSQDTTFTDDTELVKFPALDKEDDDNDNDDEGWTAINDDVYNMFFLSSVGGQAFYYAIYILIFKLTLYTFLAIQAVEKDYPQNIDPKLTTTQFLMLPVAVAMQEDLTATFFLVANIKFSTVLKKDNPHASKWKFNVANAARGIDGLYSLIVNFLILIKGDDIVSIFLNFAALQFLQTIDNIALKLAEDGYLTERLETVAGNVKKAKLPQKTNPVMRMLDSILFLFTLFVLVVTLCIIHVGYDSYEE